MINHSTLLGAESQIKNSIIFLYENKVPLYKIKEKLGIDYKKVRSIIQQCGVTLRGNHKYIFNENFFEKIDNEEKAYWLGFLYADGGVYTDGYKIHQITLKLASKDVDHLIKFKISLKSNHNIKERITYTKFSSGYEGYYKNSMLRITSVKMFNDLIKCGCVPNKSLFLQFPSVNILPEFLFNHFIRGYFDGDGCISITGKFKQFSILGTKPLLESLQSILVENCKISYTKIEIQKKSKIYRLSYGGNDVVEKIKKFLYRDSYLWMDRKKKLFDVEIIKCSRKGMYNPSYKNNIFKFKNTITSEIFQGTQYEFGKKYKIPHISSIVNKKRKSSRGWILDE